MNIDNIILDSNFLLTASGKIEAPKSGDKKETATQTATVSNSTEAPVAAEAAPQGQPLIMIIVVYGAFLVAMWFFLFRKPRQEQKKKTELRNSLKIGDNVLTTAGFYGKIVDVGTDVFIIEFGSNRGIRVPVSKVAVEGVKEPITTPPPVQAIEETK